MQKNGRDANRRRGVHTSCSKGLRIPPGMKINCHMVQIRWWFTWNDLQFLGWNPPKNNIPSLKLTYPAENGMLGRWWNLLSGPGIPSWITRRLRQDTFHLSHSSTERCLWFLELTQAFAPPMCDNWNNVNLKCYISSISKENYQTSKPSLTVRNCFLWSYDKRRPTTDASSSTPYGEFRCHLRQSGGVLYDFACKIWLLECMFEHNPQWAIWLYIWLNTNKIEYMYI